MKIEIEISEANESTSYPWWMIVSPARRFLNVEGIAHCITGPFFSREEAEYELKARRYDYGDKAIVWCASGYHSGQYRTAIDDVNKK